MFIGEDHPRDVAGKFATKEQSAPEVILGSEGASLTAELVAFIDDDAARARVWELGEDLRKRKDRALTTEDPAELVHLAWVSCYPGSDDAAMQNDHAPRSLVNAIATDPHRGRSQHARTQAVRHPAMPEDSIRDLYYRSSHDDYYAGSLRMFMAISPNTPSDVIEELWDAHEDDAGTHPNFPDARLAEALQNPARAHEVAGNPRATSEQLSGLLEMQFADDDDDDPIFRTAALARAIQNKAASDEFLTTAAQDKDPWVAKCARDAIGGRKLRDREEDL